MESLSIFDANCEINVRNSTNSTTNARVRIDVNEIDDIVAISIDAIETIDAYKTNRDAIARIESIAFEIDDATIDAINDARRERDARIAYENENRIRARIVAIDAKRDRVREIAIANRDARDATIDETSKREIDDSNRYRDRAISNSYATYAREFDDANAIDENERASLIASIS